MMMIERIAALSIRFFFFNVAWLLIIIPIIYLLALFSFSLDIRRSFILFFLLSLSLRLYLLSSSVYLPCTRARSRFELI